jgi:gliding motility-associated-like protein
MQILFINCFKEYSTSGFPTAPNVNESLYICFNNYISPHHSYEPYEMKLIIILSFCLLFIKSFYAYAQMEAAVWAVGNEKQLNFQSGSLQYIDFSGNPGVNATICDKAGNLVLSTNGDTVWNRNNEILINGTGLIEKDNLLFSTPIFIPYPEKEGYYLLIYSYVQSTFDENKDTIYKDKKLAYAEIDINANNGRGEVLSKQKIILLEHTHYYTQFGSNPTVAGFCDNSYYWLVIDYNIPFVVQNGTEKSVLLFYKIDENGISSQPKANTHFSFGKFINLHFSPDGDKLYFNHIPQTSTPFNERGVLADFNFLTGELYNYRWLEYNMFQEVTFSPDSRFIYFPGADFRYSSGLVQYDARYIDNINQTRTVILDLSPTSNIGWIGSLNLAPDGKIYFSYYDMLGENYKLARIDKPENKGVYCDLEFDVATIPGFFQPLEFATSFFRDKSLDIIDEQYADAGPDKKVCYLSDINIGARSFQPGDIYRWLPDQYIKDPFSSEVTFSTPLLYGSPKTYPLILRASDKNCWVNFDSTIVTVMPKPPKTIIDGSMSVCPYVEEADYFAYENENGLLWSVNGGEIIGDNSADSIQVTWGGSNSNASVNLVATTELGCKSDMAKFPVNITTELMPETPVGYDTLCINEAKAVIYSTQNTNGSVYEWIADGGVILDGQGSDKVTVEWIHGGQNKLFVRETSETSGASCYGESEPLEVGILNDSLNIGLSFVTFNLENKLEVHYETDKFNLNKHTLIQHTKNVNSGFMDEYYPKNSGIRGYYIYLADPEESGSQILSLEVINRCDENFTTSAQQTIVLTGEIFPEQTIISMRWNLNQFWETYRLRHEIWHSEDGKNNWELVATIGRQTSFDYDYPDISLHHYLRVKEINEDKNLASWSNTIELQVSDILKIPSVFTPNGDGVNDTWEIWNLDTYVLEGLVVYNKTGEAVYRCKRGYTPWDGKIYGKVYQGTYFYEMKFDGLKTRYGQVTVLQ